MLNPNAFTSGQIDSKLWLCNELEKLNWSSELTHVYAGWYGMLSFLLLSREQFKVKRIESFDIDPSAEKVANMINENWVSKDWQFRAHTADCNKVLPGTPDLIINTSTEHFDSREWFDNIPLGTAVVLQGNDMPHDEHVVNFHNLDKFIEHFNLTKVVYSGSKQFVYPDWQFTRFMIIGFK